jgi:outer membrane protein assembly factor BamB
VKFLFAIVPLLLVLSACSSSIDPIEPPAALTTIASPELRVIHQWSTQLGKGSGRQYLKLEPLVDGERIFIANQKGEVASYAVKDGNRLWQVESDAVINAGPGEGQDMLLFGGDAEVIALDKQDGSVRWRTPVSSEVLSVPQRLGDTVVAHCVDGNVVALDATSGKVRWQHRETVPNLSLRGSAEPVLLADAVLVGTANGKVVALSLDDGRLIWETAIAEPRGRSDLERMVDVDGRIAVGKEGVVYASSYQGSLSAIALTSGRLLWNRDIASSTGIVLDRNNLYVTDLGGDVWAISRRNGGTMWKQTALHQRALTAPVQQGKYLIVGDYDGYLHWLNKEDGSIVARSRIQTENEYWPLNPPGGEFPGNYYKEDRAVLLPPAVEGLEVYGLDKRGVLDAFHVSPAEHAE